MPFTLSHPIAVLPIHALTKRWLELEALAIGAMIPDVTYFVSLRPVENVGHTPWGILVQGIPCGLIAFTLWRGLVREPTLSIMPRAVRVRIRRAALPRSVRAWLLVCVALAIGASTHALWDTFTHAHAWGVESLPILSRSLGPLPLYKWNQYAGGALGALGIAAWCGVSLARREPVEDPAPETSARARVAAWAGILSGALALALVAALGEGPRSPSGVLVRGIIGSISGATLAASAHALLWRLHRTTRG